MLDICQAFRYTLGMNKLPIAKRTQILHMLVEGSSMRSISRVAGVSINTVTKLLVDAGEACQAFHNEAVRDVPASRIECDEIWAFCYAKAKNVPSATAAPMGSGDVWTWTGIDRDSKLIVSWLISPGRGSEYAIELMDDLRSRLANGVQLTTDGHRAYLEAVEGAFGGDVDYAQLVKVYGKADGVEAQRRYSPATCIGINTIPISGDPKRESISTSIVERHNLDHAHVSPGASLGSPMLLARSWKTTATPWPCTSFTTTGYALTRPWNGATPAMAAGLTDSPGTLEWIVDLIENRSN